jgi:hypothetical protein
MSLEVKTGVTLLGIVPQMVLVVIAVERAFDELGHACVITAGNDGSHSEASEHYAGRALDFRTRDVDAVMAQAIATRVQQALGRDFGVLLEADHLHVHYRPQRPEGGTT